MIQKKSKESPLFSVVIPLFNKEDLIGDTLRSVLAQNYQNFEVIVIDDGSTDQSALIVAEIAEAEPRIRLIPQANAHVSAARNHGIRESKGDYVAFLDADDLWRANHLEELSLLACEFPEAGMLGTAYARRLSGRQDKAGLVRELVGRRALVGDYFATAVDYQFIYTSSIAIRKDVFDAVGAFDEEDKLFSEDLALWARVSARYRVAYSGNVTVIYNCDVPGQATSGGRVQRGLSPRIGLAFKEILLEWPDLVAPRRSIQKYSDQIIYRRLMLFLLEKPAAKEGFKAYAEGGQVLAWGKSMLLRLMVQMPIPVLWRAVYLMRRCKNHLRSRFPLFGRTFKCRIIYRNEK
jgi:glycosyltransferase involved in cell wall biosynthesis